MSNFSKNQNFFLELDSKQSDKSFFEQTNEIPDWHDSHQEGELAVDVLSNEDNIIIVSTMAGAVTENIEINIHNDLLTIRGRRRSPIESNGSYHHQECYWGPFSRSIVLPVDVKADLAYAEYKNGVLKITIPKEDTERKIPVNIIEE